MQILGNKIKQLLWYIRGKVWVWNKLFKHELFIALFKIYVEKVLWSLIFILIPKSSKTVLKVLSAVVVLTVVCEERKLSAGQ